MMNNHTASISKLENRKVSTLFINSACLNCSLNILCKDSSSFGLPKLLSGIAQHPKPLHRGDHLFRQGDSFHNLYVVKSGAIKLYFTSHDGSEQIINFYFPGEILSLDSIATGLHNTSAVALDTTCICALSYKKVKTICHNQPDYYDQIFMIMAREISDEHNMLLLLGQKLAEERFAAFLFDIAGRSNHQKISQKEFLLSMTRHEIANYLCLADETISRLISKFAKDNILRIKGRQVEILDFENLKIIANIWQNQPVLSQALN